jgi:hypothetical protein
MLTNNDSRDRKASKDSIDEFLLLQRSPTVLTLMRRNRQDSILQFCEKIHNTIHSGLTANARINDSRTHFVLPWFLRAKPFQIFLGFFCIQMDLR